MSNQPKSNVVDINRARVKRGMAKLSAAIAESKTFIPTDPETLVSKSPDIARMMDKAREWTTADLEDLHVEADQSRQALSEDADLEAENRAKFKALEAKRAAERLKDNKGVLRSYRIKDIKD